MVLTRTTRARTSHPDTSCAYVPRTVAPACFNALSTTASGSVTVPYFLGPELTSAIVGLTALRNAARLAVSLP